MQTVPKHIVSAVNQILSQYGESYSPDETMKGRGFLTPGKAAEYLGVSKCTLYRAARRGELTIYKVNPGAKNGLALISISDLDAFVKR